MTSTSSLVKRYPLPLHFSATKPASWLRNGLGTQVWQYVACICVPTLYISGTDPMAVANNLNQDLRTLQSWLKANRLKLNVSNTNYIVFSYNKNLSKIMNIFVDDQKIIQVESTKFLCTHLDYEMKWGPHGNHVLNKVSAGLYALNTCLLLLWLHYTMHLSAHI